MISVQEAKDLIKEFTPVPEIEVVSMMEALNKINAEDILAPMDLPPFRQSSMDGYAIRYSDIFTSIQFIIAYEVSAGSATNLSLKSNEAVRIFTGARMPDEADTVIMQEKVKGHGQKIEIDSAVCKQGDNVRNQGQEINAGDIAIPKNTLINASAIGFLASLGIDKIKIYREPRVAILLTGNEIMTAGSKLLPGKIFDSNSYTLKAALKAIGIQNVYIEYAHDEMHKIKAALAQAILYYDVVLLTGGVSVGEYDLVTIACEEIGVQKIFHKIKQKPGKPLLFGIKDTIPVFGLPGNPASALTCFYEYVEPMLQRMMNKQTDVKKVAATINSDYTKSVGLTHFLKGHYDNGTVSVLSGQESFRLNSFAMANALIIIPESLTKVTAGDKVEVHLIH